jgi:hypothetical protein
MKTMQLEFSKSEILSLYFSENGGWHCPICGFGIGDTPAYIPTLEGNVAVASFSIYPCCDTEYGLSDSVPEGTGIQNPTERKWRRMRLGWLRDKSLTKEVLEQLANIGISNDEALSLKSEAERH